jgi:FAD-dependent urate hydroxylase
VDVDVAVLGAGPHGLSAAVHLRRAGISAQVFGDPMSFWRTMPEGLMLRSNMSGTNMVEPQGPLSLRAYMASAGIELTYPVPLEKFIDYGTWVQRTAVPDLDARAIARVERTGPGFALSLADGDQLSARHVVIAAGIALFAHVPSVFDRLPQEVASHTARHSDLAPFAGRTVAVVGGGQSAFESAALLQEHGAETEVFVRSHRVVWLRRRSPKRMMGLVGDIVYAPTDVGPMWYSRLVAAPDVFRRLPRDVQNRIAQRSIRPACAHFVRKRLAPITVTMNAEVLRAGLSGDRVRLILKNGTEREVDHVMLGTGYRVDVARYPFLDSEILTALHGVNGYPILRSGLESSVAGLHFMGAPAAWSFGPIMRFVSGSWYAGKAVARAIREADSHKTSVIARRVPVS